MGMDTNSVPGKDEPRTGTVPKFIVSRESRVLLRVHWRFNMWMVVKCLGRGKWGLRQGSARRNEKYKAGGNDREARGCSR